MIEKEEWKDIPGYENMYRVSSHGRIMSLIHKYGFRKEPIIKKLRSNRDGYPLVGLSNDGVSKTFAVHRLVAKSFCENPNGRMFVDHVDGIKSNNYASNLEWVTQSENEKRAHNLGLKSCRGVKHSQAILNDISVSIIREAWIKFGRGSQPKIAKYFGVDHATISAVVTNKRWS